MSDAYHILIIRLSSLGDILLTLPAIQMLRDKIGGVKFTFITRDIYAPMLRPLLAPEDDVFSVTPLTTRRDIRILIREKAFLAILDLHGNIRSHLWTVPAPVPVFRLPSTHLNRKKMVREGGLLQHLTPSPGVVLPVWQQYLRAAESLMHWLQHRAETHQLSELSEEEKVLKYPRTASPIHHQQNPARCVALAPGARHKSKRWPIEYFQILASKLHHSGIDVMVCGSGSERTLLRECLAGLPIPSCEVCAPEAFMQRIRSCLCTVSNDSGLMHLTEHLGTPVIALFGPTVPEFGFAPRHPASIVLQNSLDCRPCSLHGERACPLLHHACLRALTPEQVWETLQQQFLRGVAFESADTSLPKMHHSVQAILNSDSRPPEESGHSLILYLPAKHTGNFHEVSGC